MSENTISSYFQEDHRRLDGLFNQFQTLKACDYEEAKRYLKEFVTGLERHIGWEEKLLFPILEAKVGFAGPVATMRFEHEEIKKKLQELHTKVHEENPESETAEADLLYLLAQHNHKEEVVLYPLLDRLTSKVERERIFHQITQFPE